MDILLLVLLAVGFVSGLFSGAVKQIISLAAFVAGFVLACLYYQALGDILTNFLNFPTFCKIAAFVLLCVVVPILASLIASLVTKMLNFIPVLGTLNRLPGKVRTRLGSPHLALLVYEPDKGRDDAELQALPSPQGLPGVCL